VDTPAVPRSTFPPSVLRRLRRDLVAWYGRSARDLPWRTTRDPYAILVSEYMLQQTQVKTVLPYYDAFLVRFPSLSALARARDEEVRAAWSGLGYYRRARNLQAAARCILEEHAGRIPDSIEDLLDLPGVGPYTAAALASLVHEQPKAAVDGNVERVLARMVAETRVLSLGFTRRRLAGLAQELFDPDHPTIWNQAVMELGATVCVPARPRCDACPWKAHCRAYAQGNPERLPRVKPDRPGMSMERAVGVFRRNDAVLLVHRKDESLLDGTWELPGVDLRSGRNARGHLEDHLGAWLGRSVRVGPELAAIRHALTYRRVLLRAFVAEVRPQPRERNGERRWVERDEVEKLPTSSMTTKLLKQLPHTA
jgi:A/G-specific adenine glycosylase